MSDRVRVFFYGNHLFSGDRQEKLVCLALESLPYLDIKVEEILIKSDLHDTTYGDGEKAPEKMGWHETISVKTMELIETDRHLGTHIYATDKYSFDFLVLGTLIYCRPEAPTNAAMCLQQPSTKELQLDYCRADILTRV